MRARIAEGRWEVVGGSWVEPDLNLPSGESLVRQLLYAQPLGGGLVLDTIKRAEDSDDLVLRLYRRMERAARRGSGSECRSRARTAAICWWASRAVSCRSTAARSRWPTGRGS